MRKILSLVLVVAMLLSMVVLAVPASAEAAGNETDLMIKTWEKPWESSDPLVSSDWIAIGSLTDWFAVFDNANNAALAGHKYYLTADLDFSSCRDRGDSQPSDFVLDGNGHSITLAETGKNIVLFDKPGNITIKNLVIKGNVKAYGDNPDDKNGVFLSPFAKWDHSGWTKMYNVTSAINVKYTRTVDDGQYLSGLVGVCRDGSELENVKFTGSMTVGNRAMLDGVGGIAARTYGNVSIKNCSNQGNIEFQGKAACYAGGEKSAPSSQHVGVGGIVGYSEGSGGHVTFENCTNNANIFYSGFEMYYHAVVDFETNRKTQSTNPALHTDNKGNILSVGCRGYVGGILGRSVIGATFIDCENNGQITLGDSCTSNYVGYVGGIFGGIEANVSDGITMQGTVNNGDITAAYPHPMQVGGMVGYLRNNASNVFDGCANYGTLTSYKTDTRNTDYSSVGGFIGYVYGAAYPNQAITIKNSVNEGDIVSATKGTAFKELWGGFVAQACAVASITIENCVNKGDILMPTNRGTTSFVGSAGFVGTFRTVGNIDWAGYPKSTNVFKNCLNLGDVTGLRSGGIFGDNAEIKLNDATGITVDTLTVTVENCINAGNIKGKEYAGGIGAHVGQGGGFTVTVKNSSNGGTITADTSAGGVFGMQTEATVTSIEKFVNYGSIGIKATGSDLQGITEDGAVATEYATTAAGLLGGSIANVSANDCINIGTVRGDKFDPFATTGLGYAEGNKYFTSATVDDAYEGGEAIDDPATIIALADSYNMKHAANYAAIMTLIAAQKVMRAEDYLGGADWSGFKKACEAAEAVLTAPGFNPETFTQKQANKLYLNILKSYMTIVEKADVSPLDDAIASAKQILLDGVTYTSGSIKSLERAIKKAENVSALGEKAKITDITKCIEALEKAMGRMRAMPTPVDYSALMEAIDNAELLERGDYTLASWKTFESALSAARSGLSATKQGLVDSALATLTSAIEALVKTESDSQQGSDDQVGGETQPNGEGETEPTGEDGGCGSVIGGAAVILTAVVALGAGISFRKKED